MLRLVEVLVILAPVCILGLEQDYHDETSLLQVHKAVSSREKQHQEPAVVTVNGKPWGTAKVSGIAFAKPEESAPQKTAAKSSKADALDKSVQDLLELLSEDTNEEPATIKKPEESEQSLQKKDKAPTDKAPTVNIVIQQPSPRFSPQASQPSLAQAPTAEKPGGDGVEAIQVELKDTAKSGNVQAQQQQQQQGQLPFYAPGYPYPPFVPGALPPMMYPDQAWGMYGYAEPSGYPNPFYYGPNPDTASYGPYGWSDMYGYYPPGYA